MKSFKEFVENLDTIDDPIGTEDNTRRLGLMDKMSLTKSLPIRRDTNLGGGGRQEMIDSITKSLEEAPDHVLAKVNRFLMKNLSL